MKPRSSLLTGLRMGLLASLSLQAACSSGPPDSQDPSQAPGRRPVASSEGRPLFRDVAAEVGLDFQHFASRSGDLYFSEILGAGAALFDYDRDGDLDAYLVQGSELPTELDAAAQATAPSSGPPLADRLFRNELQESGRLLFTDVTMSAGLAATGYGVGVAVGDVDRDGWPDLFVSNFGANQLWRNRGDGSFEDATVKSGLGDERWSTGATFFDYDRDGHLDLFVVNYVAFTLATNKACYSETSARDYCGPLSFEPVPDRLLHNRGDGSFDDVTASSGVARAYGSGLGVVSADFDRDGLPDIYVANDGRANQLWMNRGDGTFVDDSLFSGTAFNASGAAEASMGVDAGDIDGDGDEDLFMTHLVNETNTLYVNDGAGLFDDRTAEAGLAAPSLALTGFGTGFLDYDSDGALDILVVNGAVKTIAALARSGDALPFHEPNQLFRGRGDGRFDEVSAVAGPALALSEVSRGAVFGDVDNDGDVDVLITNLEGPCRLLLNDSSPRRHWLGARVLDASGRWDELGARVELVPPEGPSLWRDVRANRSFASAGDPRVLFGLGGRSEIRAVRVLHPDGTLEEWTDLETDRYHELRHGSGRLLP